MLMMSLGGCFGKKYKVMHDGGFSSKKTAYRAGEKVTLYYEFIATDTDYTFLVDGSAVRPDFERSTGFIISFTMPDHDVTVKCIERNTMLPDGDDVIIVR
jgi:hypothetical protein